jgi:hypothetical protein
VSGIYGPPKRPSPPPEPVRPARPEHRAVTVLRWGGTIVLLLAAFSLWAYVEIEAEWRDTNRELDELQRRFERRGAAPRIDFAVPLTPIEPLQMADVIPASAIHPPATNATFEAREAPPPLQTADLIVQP